MLGFIPIFCFLFIFLSLFQRVKQPLELRGCFLLASLIWGVLIVLSTEILSLSQLLTFKSVLIFWIIATIPFLTFSIRTIKTTEKFNLSKIFHSFILTPLNQTTLPSLDKIILWTILFIILMIGFIAIKAAPNNWDSMTYHLSRVEHWIQNQTVANYPTHILKQLTYPPFAEYAVLHLRILSGGDSWANLIQWFCMVGNIIGVSLISKQLGANFSGQSLSSVLAATIPMGILQGSSIQNDQVAAFGIVCFVCFFLFYRNPSQSENKTRVSFNPIVHWISVCAMGTSLGLSLLTKTTGYFYLFPFCISLVLIGIKKYHWKIFVHLFIMGLIVVMLNLSFYTRNFSLSQSILPNLESKDVFNQTHHLPFLISNVIRNIGLHMATPFKGINRILDKGIHGFHKFLSVPLTDERTTYGEHEFHIKEIGFHEDYAGNLLHLILILIGTAIFLFKFLFKQKDLRGLSIHPNLILEYFVCVTLGFLLFSCVLKWQPWHSRLHLPLFILSSPLLGVILSLLCKPNVLRLISIFFILCSMPWVWDNKSRVFFKRRNIFNSSRIEQYFYNKHGYIYSYEQAVKEIRRRGCSQVGLFIGPDSWEYPFWVLMKKDNPPKVRLEHIKVSNVSSWAGDSFPLGPFDPCAIIDDNLGGHYSKIHFQGKNYIMTRKFAYLRVLIRDDTGELSRQSLVFHFQKLLEYSNESAHFMRKRTLARDLTQDLEKLFDLKKSELKEAQQIDPEELNRIFPKLGDYLKDNLSEGLKLLIDGYESSDPIKFQNGQEKLTQWDIFVNQNLPQIQKAFQTWQGTSD